MNQFKVGDVKITRIIESEAPWPGTWLLPNATLENVKKEADWLYPTFSDEKGKLRMSIHALVLESQGKRIIVDTCIGNEKVRSNAAWNNLQTPFLSDFEKAGFTRDNIEHVVCTHLHVDHVGWNTMLKDGKWVPTFNNAQYVIGEPNGISGQPSTEKISAIRSRTPCVLSSTKSERTSWNRRIQSPMSGG